MNLNDLFGFFRRNVKKMSQRDKERAYKEMKSIVVMLEKELNIT